MLDFMRYAHYNKMEYGYDLLIRCNRCPTAPLRGQAAVKKKWGQTPRDRHCERKKASEAAKRPLGGNSVIVELGSVRR